MSALFPTGKGVKQGCMLAPVLFNLHINNIVPRLTGSEFVPPMIGQQKNSILLYVDDMALFYLSRIGLDFLINLENTAEKRNFPSIIPKLK